VLRVALRRDGSDGTVVGHDPSFPARRRTLLVALPDRRLQ